jgi:hypothetical protein
MNTKESLAKLMRPWTAILLLAALPIGPWASVVCPIAHHGKVAVTSTDHQHHDTPDTNNSNAPVDDGAADSCSMALLCNGTPAAELRSFRIVALIESQTINSSLTFNYASPSLTSATPPPKLA